MARQSAHQLDRHDHDCWYGKQNLHAGQQISPRYCPRHSSTKFTHLQNTVLRNLVLTDAETAFCLLSFGDFANLLLHTHSHIQWRLLTPHHQSWIMGILQCTMSYHSHRCLLLFSMQMLISKASHWFHLISFFLPAINSNIKGTRNFALRTKCNCEVSSCPINVSEPI